MIDKVIIGDATLYRADVLDGLSELPCNSVQCCVTSPPYWGLRDYGTADWEGGDADCDHVDEVKLAERKRQKKSMIAVGERMDGSTRTRVHDEAIGRQWQYQGDCPKCGAKRIDRQIGLEPTLQGWLDAIVMAMAAVRRVLRPDGTLWLNIGDAYASTGSGKGQSNMEASPGKPCDGFRDSKYLNQQNPSTVGNGLKPKDCLLMDYRLALALQADGWWVRSKIVWAKPNPMPESVTDRPTSSYELVFLLTKSARYYYDADAVREEHSRDWAGCIGPNNAKVNDVIGGQEPHRGIMGAIPNPSGRNARNVWTIPTQPYPDAHFATYPEELVRRCIAAGTSERGCCPKCGKPWERVVDIDYEVLRKSKIQNQPKQKASAQPFGFSKCAVANKITKTLGWQPACKCGGEPIPCTVLDPFAGSLTTILVALKIGRRAIGIELSPEYMAMGIERISKEANQTKMF